MAAKLIPPFNRADDPRLQPAYSVAEAAHYVRTPEATLRSWVAGRLYPVSGRPRRSKPVIQLDDPRRRYLSFINLVETHVLTAIRRRHNVRLPKVRRALDYVRREFHIDRPLIDQAFQTVLTLKTLVEHYGQMINASRAGQQAMREIISVYLQRIERDTTGLPVKLYPFTRDTESDATPKSDPRLIVMSPAISFGRPVIAGTGIPSGTRPATPSPI